MSQIQEYLLDDGTYVRGREHARFISIPNLIAIASRFVPPRGITLAYLVMTCVHEAGDRDEPMTGIAWNERDTEADGKRYYGVAMIDEEEARRYGRTGPEMHDPAAALEVLCELATEHLGPILRAGGHAAGRGLPFVIDDVPAYLALAHNEGLGSESNGRGALGTIALHGLDWCGTGGYEERNPTRPIVAHRYGRDCVDGGKLAALLQNTSSAP